jgi:transcriptional regulator with XRE-family HTH domain
LPKCLVNLHIGTPAQPIARRGLSVFTAPGGVKQLPRRLNAERVSQLKEGYEEGKTVYQLAAEFGIARQTVSEHLKRSGAAMRLRGIDERDRAEMVALRGEGWSYARLGERFGVDPTTVWRFLTGQ